MVCQGIGILGFSFGFDLFVTGLSTFYFRPRLGSKRMKNDIFLLYICVIYNHKFLPATEKEAIIKK